MLKKTWETLISICQQVAKAVWKHYIGIVAGVIIIGITNAYSFVLGKNTQEVTVVDQPNRFGAHCVGTLVRSNNEHTPNFKLTEPGVLNTLVCGRGTNAKATPEASLERYVERYDLCFSYDPASTTLSLYNGEDSLLERFPTTNGQDAVACNCVAGQAKMIATHNAGKGKWCGVDTPDPEEM
jgi:hypothetical protein